MRSTIDSVKSLFSLFGSLLSIVLFLIFVCAIPYGIYSTMDEDGEISHTVETSISVQENWLIGESKECTSPVLDAKTAEYIHQESGYVASFVACDDGSQHAIKVKFYGQLNQPTHKLILWRCTRESEGFTCKQKGAVH